MAKKVFPIHIGASERRILEVLSAREGVSLAEAARRCIQAHEHVLVKPAHEQTLQSTSDNAA